MNNFCFPVFVRRGLSAARPKKIGPDQGESQCTAGPGLLQTEGFLHVQQGQRSYQRRPGTRYERGAQQDQWKEWIW